MLQTCGFLPLCCGFCVTPNQVTNPLKTSLARGTSHAPTKERCQYTTSANIKKTVLHKRIVTHSESQERSESVRKQRLLVVVMHVFFFLSSFLFLFFSSSFSSTRTINKPFLFLFLFFYSPLFLFFFFYLPPFPYLFYGQN